MPRLSWFSALRGLPRQDTEPGQHCVDKSVRSLHMDKVENYHTIRWDTAVHLRNPLQKDGQ